MRCFFIAAVLAITEALIANFVDDHVIRVYIGDIIGIFFLYFLCRIFTKENMLLPVGVLIIAIATETAGMYDIGSMIIEKTGSENENVNELIRTVTGFIFNKTFDMEDIICFIIGVVFIYLGIAVKKMLGRE
ncbi:MAG: hypothetical protein IJ736_09875 [Firmicutes bacterium]|nr:hypothetical protein [Bacillota bacterium]